MDNYHLSPTAEGCELKKEGAERTSNQAATKEELISSLSDFLTAKYQYPEIDSMVARKGAYP